MNINEYLDKYYNRKKVSKNGSFDINNITDIDKFASVIKNYGGTGSKGIFITDAKMSDSAKQKCNEHNILTFSLQDENMGMTHEKALSIKLDSELFNINM